MADASWVQTSFLGGEWSKHAQGRTDRPDYRSAMNLCRNIIPVEPGAAPRRSGTRFCGTTRGGGKGRLIKWDFQQQRPYQLEWTDGHMRAWLGATLVTTNDDKDVYDISTATPAEVITVLLHGWQTGDQIMLADLGVRMPALQNKLLTITVGSNPQRFTIADALTGAPIDGSTLGWVFPSPEDRPHAKRVFDLPTPYSTERWMNLRLVQAEGEAVLLSGLTPQILTAATPPTGQYATFTIAPAKFIDGPYLDPIKGSQVTADAVSGNINITLTFPAWDTNVSYSIGDCANFSGQGYQSLIDANAGLSPPAYPSFWRAVTGGALINDGRGFLASDVGRLVRLFSEPQIWSATVTYSTGQSAAYQGAYYTANTNTTLAVPPLGSTEWNVNPEAARWTWGKITSLSASGLINPALPGSIAIGNLTFNRGIDGAFDGVTSKTFGASSDFISTAGDSPYPTPNDSGWGVFIGKDFGGVPQRIAFVTAFPTSDYGFAAGMQFATFNLRASQTFPTAVNDGTLLGTAGALFTLAPVTIQSNDQATSWRYVWLEMVVIYPAGPLRQPSPANPATWYYERYNVNIGVAQLQMYGSAAASGGVALIQLLGDPLLYAGAAIRTWLFGLYSDTTGWPTCGTYHEGRLWLSGAVKNRIDGSVPNSFADGKLNFAPTLASGQIIDSNAIAYRFNAPNTNPIFWMEPDQQGIICGTQAGEWLVQATSQNSPLTPTSMQAHLATTVKCANIEPRRTEHTLVFAQFHRRKVIEYFGDVSNNKLTAPNLSRDAKHLTKPGLAELAYQQELAPIIWARLDDGSLIGCTYRRESLVSSDPPRTGWHAHTLGSGRLIESISVGPAATSGLDSLSLVTNDPVTSQRHVEVMTDLFEEGDALTAAWYLDSAVIPSSTASTVNGYQIYGLHHLEAKVVAIFAGGLDLGDFQVQGGAILVPWGDGIDDGPGHGLFTESFINGFTTGFPVIVGQVFTSQGQCVRAMSRDDSGARQGSVYGAGFGKTRRSHKFAFQLFSAVNEAVTFGTEFARLRTLYLKSAGGTALTPLQTFTGIARDDSGDDYSFDSMPCWQVTRPLPATMVAIGAYLQTQDI